MIEIKKPMGSEEGMDSSGIVMRKSLMKAYEKMQSNHLDPASIEISFEFSMFLDGWVGDGEPNDVIHKYFISIDERYGNNYVKKRQLGEARCYYLPEYNGASQKLIDLRDTADADSGDLLVALTVLTNKNGTLKDDYIGEGVLYIDKFYLKPKYRNRGLGTMALALIIDVLGRGVGVSVVIPHPFEDNCGERIDETDPRYKTVLKQMIAIIKKFGFVRVKGKEEVWIKDMTLAEPE